MMTEKADSSQVQTHLARSAAGVAAEEELVFDPRTGCFIVAQRGSNSLSTVNPDVVAAPYNRDGFF